MPRSSNNARRWTWASLLVLIAIIGAGHVAWLRADQGPMPSPDAYRNLLGGLRLADTVSGVGPAGFPSLEALSPGGRPPTYQVLSVPFLLLFGRSVDAGLAVNGLFLFLMMVATHALATRRAPPATGLLAALLVATAPPIVHLLHTYRAQAALPAAVAVSLWLLVQTLERRTPAWCLGFWASLAFGIALHPTYIFIMLAPALYGTLVLAAGERRPGTSPRSVRQWLLDRVRDPVVLRGLALGMVLTAAVLAIWYVVGPGWRLLAAFVQAGRHDASRRVAEVADPTASIWWYATTAPFTLGTIVTGLALLALVTALIRRGDATERTLLITIVGSYAILAALPTRAWMYAAPALPAVAALLARWSMRLRSPALRVVVVLALVTTSVFHFIWVSWGPEDSPVHPLASFLGVRPGLIAGCVNDRNLCANRPDPRPANAGFEPLLERILRDPTCSRKTCQLLIVGRRFPNGRMLRYFMIERWPHARLTLVGQGTGRYGGRYPISNLVHSDFIVYQPPRRRNAFAGARTFYHATQSFLAQPSPLFEARHKIVARFKTPRGPLVLIKRIHPPSEAERAEIIDSLGVDRRTASRPNRDEPTPTPAPDA